MIRPRPAAQSAKTLIAARRARAARECGRHEIAVDPADGDLYSPAPLIFPGSSAVEQAAVNRRVGGSNPSPGARVRCELHRMSETPVTIPLLHQMKRDGRKIVGVVAWDYQIAKIVDRAGVDIISVGDTVGDQSVGPRQSARGHARPEMLVVLQGRAARDGRALVSVRFPVRARCKRASTARSGPRFAWSRRPAPI